MKVENFTEYFWTNDFKYVDSNDIIWTVKDDNLINEEGTHFCDYYHIDLWDEIELEIYFE